MERMESIVMKRTSPTTEVSEKPARRWFTAEYKLRILAEADRCTELGLFRYVRPSGKPLSLRLLVGRVFDEKHRLLAE